MYATIHLKDLILTSNSSIEALKIFSWNASSFLPSHKVHKLALNTTFQTCCILGPLKILLASH